MPSVEALGKRRFSTGLPTTIALKFGCFRSPSCGYASMSLSSRAVDQGRIGAFDDVDVVRRVSTLQA